MRGRTETFCSTEVPSPGRGAGQAGDPGVASLAARTTRKVPTAEQEARATYTQAHERAIKHQWDAVLDTSGDPRPDATLRRLLP